MQMRFVTFIRALSSSSSSIVADLTGLVGVEFVSLITPSVEPN